MQKKIIALAIAAAFAAPVAMADVTMYGTLDAGLRHQTNDTIAAGGTTDSMQLGQYNSSRWGMKSSEDMGDGMKTNVVLEGGLSNPATGGIKLANGVFERQATIGVAAGWGAVDVGWNYTTSFKVVKSLDPFNYNYINLTVGPTTSSQQAGAGSAVMAQRAGNIVYTGKFGGATVLGEYVMNDSQANSQPTTGTGRAVGVIYVAGPVGVSASYSTQEAGIASDNPSTHVAAGGSFNFGDGKVFAAYTKKATRTAASDSTDTNMWVGATFAMSSKIGLTAAYYTQTGNLGATTSVDTTKKTTRVGSTYSLSKATQLYLAVDRSVQNSGGAALDAVTVGTSAGLSTAF